MTIWTTMHYEANKVDPDQAAPIGAALSGSTLFVKAYISGKGLNKF